MTQVKYNRPMMSQGIFNLLDDIFSEDFFTPTMSHRRETIPAVNVRETEKAYELEMAVPGMDKKDINVEIEENMLTISSEMKEENNEENDGYSRREFRFNSFKRSFNIPEDSEASKIDARHENGVLYVSIPKKEAKPSLKKMIKVS